MTRRCRLATLGFVLAVAGCDAGQPPAAPPAGPPDELSDPERVRAADVSILFVGNSHTSSHGLPDLIGQLIRFRHPERTVYSQVITVDFLEDAARVPRCAAEVGSRPWKHVVLQAQKESRSGRFEYSRAEGINLAKLGTDRGAGVLFYSEWGVKDVPGHGRRIETMYREMAAASGARVAPVGRAWELALAARPELPLYDFDGNHQSAVGTFLTACVLAGRLTGESPAAFAPYPYPDVSEADREFLATAAARALAAAE